MGSLITKPITTGVSAAHILYFLFYFQSKGDAEQNSIEVSHLYNGPC